MRAEWLAWLRLFKAEILTVALLSMATNMLMIVPSLYMLQVYDRVLASRNELTLISVSLLTLISVSFMPLVEWFRSKVLIQTSLRIHETLAEHVFRATFNANLRNMNGQPTKPLSDLTELRQYFTGSAVVVFFDLPWIPVFVGALFLLHPILGWAALGFAALQAVVAYTSQEMTKLPMQNLAIQNQVSIAQISANLKASDAIQAMGMLQGLYRRWDTVAAKYLRTHAAAHGLQNRNIAFSKWIRLIQQSLMLGAGALLAIEGEISAGAMVAANVLATRALAPVDLLVSSWRGFLTAKDAYRRTMDLLSDTFSGEKKNAPIESPSGDVRLEGIFASHPNAGLGELPILRNVNLTLEPGKITVLMGPSGSGKTTLVRILLGIWPCSSGGVWWGTYPIERWAAKELGVHVGYLPQDVQLFDGSIAQNIARQGNLNPLMVTEAAKMAGFHDAILRLPQGYDTPIGVGGVPLSGGQRQRVGLARALYGNPSLIVLDEPNANLDDAGEKALAIALGCMKNQGASLLVISHRPQLMAISDRVICLKDGAILSLQPQTNQ